MPLHTPIPLISEQNTHALSCDVGEGLPAPLPHDVAEKFPVPLSHDVVEKLLIPPALVEPIVGQGHLAPPVSPRSEMCAGSGIQGQTNK